MKDNEHMNVRVTGRVQGVFFRVIAKQKADELGVVGFARNESDGSVYIEVEGSGRAVDQFLTWCKEGPIQATVKSIGTEEGDIQDFNSFDIK